MKLQTYVHGMGALLLAGFAACSTGTAGSSPGQTSGANAGANVGTIGLAFTIPGGVTLDAIDYTIAGPTNTSGIVDLSHSQRSVEFAVGDLTAGSGYTITISGTDTNGDLCASTPTPFSINVLQTTPLDVTIYCTQGEGGYVLADAGTGSLQVDAAVVLYENPTTTCPTIASLGAANAEFETGTSTTITVATDPPGSAVSFSMIATDDAGAGAGTVTPTMAGATFTCTNPGQVQLTATTTAPLLNDSGVCPSQSQSLWINCELLVPPPCPTGLTSCGPDCVNLLNDPNHCGACDTVCPAGDACDETRCVPAVCMPGFSNCSMDGGINCIFTQGDLDHCGSCDNVCPPGETCQQGVCQPPIPPGRDLVVFNDINPFDNTGITDPDNVTMVQNLVNFTPTAPTLRSAGTVVLMSYGHGSRCAEDSECGDFSMSTMYSVIEGTGLTVQDSTSDTLTSFDPSVKVIFLWNPLVDYTLDEINAFKQFASEGGRLVFVGEWDGYYGAGINLENSFLVDMGALMINTGGAVDCGYTMLPKSSLRPHEITTGMNGVEVACASVIVPGPHDYPLYYDSTNTQLLAGVAAINTTPFPEDGGLPDPPLYSAPPTKLNTSSSTGM